MHPPSSLCSCETARRRLLCGHSRTHHKLRTHQSKVKMATIIAQQLSAGYVPLPDPPRRRAGDTPSTRAMVTKRGPMGTWGESARGAGAPRAVGGDRGAARTRRRAAAR